MKFVRLLKSQLEPFLSIKIIDPSFFLLNTKGEKMEKKDTKNNKPTLFKGGASFLSPLKRGMKGV